MDGLLGEMTRSGIVERSGQERLIAEQFTGRGTLLSEVTAEKLVLYGCGILETTISSFSDFFLAGDAFLVMRSGLMWMERSLEGEGTLRRREV